MKYDFSDLTKQLQALNNKLHSQIVNFSGIDEKGMRLEYYNNTYINVDDMNSLQNNVLYITGLPASGKSELAEKLSKEYGIPVIGLDELANTNFDYANKTIQKYFEASQSSDYEVYSGNEAENFLHWLKTKKLPTPVMLSLTQHLCKFYIHLPQIPNQVRNDRTPHKLQTVTPSP